MKGQTLRTTTPIKAITPPEKAGVVRIEFGPIDVPRRREDVITLPQEATDLRYFSLMDGDQFAVVIGDRAPHIYFGGTDEAPFLVELDPMHLLNLGSGGELGFYQGLKPLVIAKLEERHGTDHTGRQGDIWFYDLALSWEQVDRDHRQISGSHFITSKLPTSLFRTRHMLEGGKIVRHGTQLTTPSGPMGTKKEAVGDGMLSAPDHDTVILEGPHVFGRTPGILPGGWSKHGRLGD